MDFSGFSPENPGGSVGAAPNRTDEGFSRTRVRIRSARAAFMDTSDSEITLAVGWCDHSRNFSDNIQPSSPMYHALLLYASRGPVE